MSDVWRPNERDSNRLIEVCKMKIKARTDPTQPYAPVAKKCRDCIHWADATKGRPKDHECMHKLLTNNESMCRTYHSMGDSHGWEDVQTGESARAKKRRLAKEREAKGEQK